MSALTKFQTAVKELMLLQTDWISKINPFLANPANNSSILKDVVLATGTNTINHLLGRTLQGWSIIRRNAAATVYDAQASNPRPELTLVLVASAPITVSLEVF
jgi:hypothetical protein